MSGGSPLGAVSALAPLSPGCGRVRRHGARGVLLACLVGALLFVAHTLYYTPFIVYVLDQLNLRPFFLPDIMCAGACNNFNHTYLVENAEFCGAGDEELLLLIVVVSYHPNVDARQTIRNTWGGVREHHGHKVRTLFVFGVHADRNFNRQVDYEMTYYGDVIQADFKDNYRNLTTKTMVALGWVRAHCRHARYVLKTDDDGFNVPQRYVEYLATVHAARFVGGYCFTVMPDRRDSSKFYIPYSQYPDMYYPTYCSGPGYVLSQAAVRDIVRAAPRVSYLHMEDVFVSGMCRVAAGIQYVQISGTVIDQRAMTRCALATWAKNSHNVWPGHVPRLWENVMAARRETDCLGRNTLIFIIFILAAALWAKLLYSLAKKR